SGLNLEGTSPGARYSEPLGSFGRALRSQGFGVPHPWAWYHWTRITTMSPLLLSFLVFLAIEVVIGALFFVYSGGGGKMSDRLDALTGKKKKEDEATSILKRTAYDRDKKNLLEMFTPNIVSL